MSECRKYQLLLQTDYARLREKYDDLYTYSHILSKGVTIHRMYRNRDYFGDGSVHDTWRPLTMQII